MYSNILIPVDLSHPERGEPMIKVAQQVGSKDARITLINVVEDLPGFVALELPEGTLTKVREQAGDELRSIANAAGIKALIEISQGSAHSAILHIAGEQDTDLIIIGSHKPGLQDYFIGSTAARVVRHADCSVLVVR